MKKHAEHGDVKHKRRWHGSLRCSMPLTEARRDKNWRAVECAGLGGLGNPSTTPPRPRPNGARQPPQSIGSSSLLLLLLLLVLLCKNLFFDNPQEVFSKNLSNYSLLENKLTCSFKALDLRRPQHKASGEMGAVLAPGENHCLSDLSGLRSACRSRTEMK